MNHQERVNVIKERLETKKDKENGHPLSITEISHHSNTVRGNDYRKKGPSLGIKNLKSIIAIYPEEKKIVVEPQVTMEQLVEFTLNHHLIPAVVPEFKGITVGGAVMGAALESSSHIHGQFNDCCLSYELLLGCGKVITASPSENSDLYYAVSGSYGAFGVILSVTLKLIPTTKWVQIECADFEEVSKAIDYMNQMHLKGSSKYLEAIVYRKDHIKVITANNWEINESPPRGNCWASLYNSPFYYQSIKDLAPKEKRYMKIKDYIFRHDRGAFWMGSYILYGSLFLRFVLDRLGYCPKWLKKTNKKNSERYHLPKYPGKIFRSLFGWTMSTQFLYPILHSSTEKWFSQHFVIQDFYIPQQNTANFVEDVLQKFKITPLWLCPILPTKTAQFLSPHFKPNLPPMNGSDSNSFPLEARKNEGAILENITPSFSEPGVRASREKITSNTTAFIDGNSDFISKNSKEEVDLLFDVGIYGFPQSKMSCAEITRHLEQLTEAFRGRKMLYGDSYYFEEEFWKIYSKELYLNLRKKYSAEGSWLNITEKVLNRRIRDDRA